MGRHRPAMIAFVAMMVSLSVFGATPRLLHTVSNETVHRVEASRPIAVEQEPADTLAGAQILQVADSVSVAAGDSVGALLQDSVPLLITDSLLPALQADSSGVETVRKSWRPSSFNPDPMRAVWLSALFPGLGQIYNRRYWKLPIVVGGYVGLFYATTWNSNMLADYQRAYLDIMDSDPTTNSYMDFFASSYREEDIDKTWLTNVLKQRKDYYRQYRDLCIICMIGLYAVCMIDAYVDAQLYHFDISPDLSMQWQPAIIPTARSVLPAVGLQCAITF